MKATFQWSYMDLNPSYFIALYIVGGMQLTNLAFAPAIVTINHNHLMSKDVRYFKWHLEYQNSEVLF